MKPIDTPFLVGAPTSGGTRLRLAAELAKVEGALDMWDEHDADPLRVEAPQVTRETLRATRAMLMGELELDEWRDQVPSLQ